MPAKPADQYDDEEAARRFEAALRGARLATPKPMTDFVGKGKRATPRAEGRVQKDRSIRAKIALSFARFR